MLQTKWEKRFQLWMHNCFAQGITRRMEAIALKTRHLFEQRYLAWLSWKGKSLPAISEKDNKAIEVARGMIVETSEGQLLNVLKNGTSSVSANIEK